MNLYQTLNREYREFRLKQSLKENEDPTVSAIADTLSESKESNEDELARRLVGLSDALNTATDPDEIKAIQAEIEEIKSKLDELDAGIAPKEPVEDSENTNECDNKEIKEAGANLDISAGVDIPDDLASAAGMALLASDEDGTSEATEENKEEVEEGEPISAVAKITELAGIPKEDIIKEIGAVSEEEKEALNSSLCTLKEVFDELCPKTDEVEEANAPQSEDVVQDCEATPIHEAEVASYKVVRVAPKVSAYMIEAQTKEGIKFITGKNFNENDKTLEEAEISDSKLDATNRFKSLLENK